MAREKFSCVSRYKRVAGHAEHDGSEYRQGAWSCLDVDDSMVAPNSCSSSSRWNPRSKPTKVNLGDSCGRRLREADRSATNSEHFQAGVGSIVSCSH